MHATVLVDPAPSGELDAAEAVGEELFALVVALGGSIAGEHGVGWIKRGRLQAQWPERALALHEEIKRVFDPKGLAQPRQEAGKVPCGARRHPTKGHSMNKTQLIDAVAADSGLTKADSARAIESLLDTVTRTLKKGDEVSITGFGKFSVVKRAARQGVNPRTGERVKIKASKAPKFSAGAGLKQAVSPKKK